ncbi:ABC transporter substrate-binding protein [Terrisporobacter petrolearius]|uniref:ABC transporter substrate-binding protein n=1 Tax=Terrisporobacter petrolearius TaxID=1460447 RepID=UPI001D1668F9|nr:ABC transporter substrate-binding protein [Terrisporobacter petrolearius]MCC3864779.1 ABC transporter substrate-binding protein [Terrisporobacter petrolearius]
MKLKKNIAKLLSMVLLVGALAGCSNSSNSGSDTSTKSGVEQRKKNNELVVAVGAEPEAGFDAITGGHGSITKVFFSTLMKRDKELGWENDLATDYKISKDKLTWTVKIRDDAKFTDGKAVTAQDVAFTYETTKKSSTEIDLTMIKEVKAKDDTTVEFKLERPMSTFVEKLGACGIVPKHAYNDSFKDNPIGSGPYKFVQWDKGQQVIAEANADYYGEKPSIKKLTMVFLEIDAAYAAVKSGDVDMASINGDLAKEKVEGTKILDIPSIETYGVEFPMVANTGKKTETGYEIGNNVTSDEAIRKAFNTAVDRQGMVDGVLNGYGSVSTTGLEKMPWLNKESVLEESDYNNIQEAKKILKDGGWKDSDNDGILEKDKTKASFKVLYTPGNYRQALGLEFQKIAKELGIEITLEERTWDTILKDIHKEAVLFGWGSGDPSELYNLYYGKAANTPVEWDNAGFYDNKTVDKYIDKALNSEDEKEALPYWQKAQFDGKTGACAKGDAPYCWLVNANHVYIVSEGFDIGKPVVQPHGGRIFDNVTEWAWK